MLPNDVDQLSSALKQLSKNIKSNHFKNDYDFILDLGFSLTKKSIQSNLYIFPEGKAATSIINRSLTRKDIFEADTKVGLYWKPTSKTNNVFLLSEKAASKIASLNQQTVSNISAIYKHFRKPDQEVGKSISRFSWSMFVRDKCQNNQKKLQKHDIFHSLKIETANASEKSQGTLEIQVKDFLLNGRNEL